MWFLEGDSCVSFVCGELFEELFSGLRIWQIEFSYSVLVKSFNSFYGDNGRLFIYNSFCL